MPLYLSVDSMPSSPPTLSISAHWPQVCAISFDLDDTLWPIEPVIEKAEIQLWEWLHRHYPKITARHDVLSLRRHRVEIAAAFPELIHSVSGLRLQALRNLMTEFDYAADQRQATELAEPGWQLFYAARHQIDWFSDAQPALRRLKAHYPIAAATNGNADLAKLGVADWFSARISANDVGHAKPDAPLWDALCDALNLAPEQILHIGDHPEQDILGAMRHGLPAIWLNRQQADWPNKQACVSIASLNQLMP